MKKTKMKIFFMITLNKKTCILQNRNLFSTLYLLTFLSNLVYQSGSSSNSNKSSFKKDHKKINIMTFCITRSCHILPECQNNSFDVYLAPIFILKTTVKLDVVFFSCFDNFLRFECKYCSNLKPLQKNEFHSVKVQ